MSAQTKNIQGSMNDLSGPIKIRTTDSAKITLSQLDLNKLVHRLRVLEKRVDGFVFNPLSKPINISANDNSYYSTSTQIYTDFSLFTTDFNGVSHNISTSNLLKNNAIVIEGIPIYLAIELAALIIGSFCAISFIVWAAFAVNFLNPLIAILGFTASLFFFAMGRVSRNEHITTD